MKTATLAESFRWALRFGTIERRIVVDWADGQIAAQDEPDYWLIEVSTSPERDLESRLAEAPGKPDQQEGMNQFLGYVHHLWERGRITIGALRGLGWVLHCEGLLECSESEGDWGVVLECIGEELDEGWTTEADFRDYACQALRQYASFTGFTEVMAAVRNQMREHAVGGNRR